MTSWRRLQDDRQKIYSTYQSLKKSRRLLQNVFISFLSCCAYGPFKDVSRTGFEDVLLTPCISFVVFLCSSSFTHMTSWWRLQDDRQKNTQHINLLRSHEDFFKTSSSAFYLFMHTDLLRTSPGLVLETSCGRPVNNFVCSFLVVLKTFTHMTSWRRLQDDRKKIRNISIS